MDQCVVEALRILKCKKEALALVALNVEAARVQKHVDAALSLMRHQLVGKIKYCAPPPVMC